MANPICFVLIKEETKEDALSEAEYALEAYNNVVFNHIESAGKKASGEDYHILNANDITVDRFLSELENLQVRLKSNLDDLIGRYRTRSLGDIIEDTDLDLWQISEGLKIANGDFTFDCPFYNAISDSTKITPEITNDIITNPDCYWLIPFELKL